MFHKCTRAEQVAKQIREDELAGKPRPAPVSNPQWDAFVRQMQENEKKVHEEHNRGFIVELIEVKPMDMPVLKILDPFWCHEQYQSFKSALTSERVTPAAGERHDDVEQQTEEGNVQLSPQGEG